MYRQGLGDCFLITIPRRVEPPYRIMIDCGVILGTKGAGTTMQRVMQSILDETKGTIDVLVATHQHWDHLSGFAQAEALFNQLKIGALWLAWTEDPKDTLANSIRAKLTAMKSALRVAGTAMHASGDPGAGEVNVLLESFGEAFGAAGGRSTDDALNIIKAKADKDKIEIKYFLPGSYFKLADPSIGVYVLGPPRDEKMLHKTLPSKAAPETYGLSSFAETADLAGAFTAEDKDAPFDGMRPIPWVPAQGMEFFQHYYWGNGAEARDWRRIDSAWLGGAADLALALDSATNNTSLVLAFEFEKTEAQLKAAGKTDPSPMERATGDVLLFVADAQVGNWLSWEKVKFKDGPTKSTTELLNRSIFYKVGHHGSHNATLREKGLELMTSLRYAAIPVDHEMAKVKHWGNMPLPELVEALHEHRKGQVVVVRIDEEPATHPDVTANRDYIEIRIPPSAAD